MNEPLEPRGEPQESLPADDFEAALRRVAPVSPKQSWEAVEARLQSSLAVADEQPVRSQAVASTASGASWGWSHVATGLLGLAAGMLIMTVLPARRSDDIRQSVAAADPSQQAPQEPVGGRLPNLAGATSGDTQDTQDTQVPWPSLPGARRAQPEGTLANRRLSETQVTRLSDGSLHGSDPGRLVVGNHLTASATNVSRSSPASQGRDVTTTLDDWSPPNAAPPTPSSLMQEILQSDRIF